MELETKKPFNLKRAIRRINTKLRRNPYADLKDIICEVAAEYDISPAALDSRIRRRGAITQHQIILPGE